MRSVHKIITGYRKGEFMLHKSVMVHVSPEVMFVRNTFLNMSLSCCTDAPARYKENYSSHVTIAQIQHRRVPLLDRLSALLKADKFEEHHSSLPVRALRSTLKVYGSTPTPMTTVEAERCFLTLKRVKPFLRNTLNQGRLDALDTPSKTRD